ncbi:MAG: DUF5694 domain-containing protein [Pyrinomonadaceae bacterium]
MKIGRTSCGVVLLLFVFVTLASPQTKDAATPVPAKRARVLVLGVFHMANPGRDMFNLQVDDVLAPKRQRELSELAEILKKFQPTKIALEAPAGSEKVRKQYEDYLAGNYLLTRNETDQIGFRLAKDLEHKQVYGIDIDGDFPFEAIMQFAKKNGKEETLNRLISQVPKEIEAMSGVLSKGTISDLLRYINADEHVKRDHQFYMSLAQFAGKGEYPGPDLLAAWYQRNIRIYSNLRGIIDSPDDRVLVIYGSGHLFWLQRDVFDSPDLELVRLSDYAK